MPPACGHGVFPPFAASAGLRNVFDPDERLRHVRERAVTQPVGDLPERVLDRPVSRLPDLDADFMVQRRPVKRRMTITSKSSPIPPVG